MPNWCENTLTITHKDHKKLKKLHKEMLKNNFLNSVIPVPKQLQDERTSSYGGEDKELKDKLREKMLEKYGYESWYDFCVDRWGTKWDVEINDAELHLDSNCITAGFSSAWSPPTGVYQELTNQGFDVEAKFFEPNMDYVGTYTSEEGELIYSLSDAPQELDDEFGISEFLKECEELEDDSI